jgi:hypothetical protein
LIPRKREQSSPSTSSGLAALKRGVADWAQGAHKGLTCAADSDKTLACGILVTCDTLRGFSGRVRKISGHLGES